ncbi:MAG: type II toxin-antitoxin system VapC family toxin [Bacillota bacterium]
MKVFVDTSAWIALVAAKDPHHEAVAAAWREMLGRGARPVTTSDVLTETITFLRYRAGHRTAVDFRETVGRAVEEGRLRLVWVDEELFAQAWAVFLRYADWELSMADCTGLALCRREKIRTALTLDRHFRVAGLETVPEIAARR